ncbi:hypothetical protein K488DRAFT_75815 [Vararia minispora EC-137]|uniref:Uncharacterized protein n=1 Tax=Vararia minispora EC-137 TaxID=1314806 RepID=A0ACB8QYN2_9AGAM|nr:hypothetical protein K488DRAFT_75815 [Vararia minispora EC-137]
MQPPHSRSNSVSSSSPQSRPQSSQGDVLRPQAAMGPPSAEDLFRPAFARTQSIANDHTRTSSHSSAYSFSSTDLASPADSPPNHALNPASKPHLRSSHIRARVQASPYPRDAESVHSSSSETEDISMYLAAGDPADYHAMFAAQPLIHSQDNPPSNPAFARMPASLSPDHALERLAANVRAATTTSASDRAKQIFVQAWLTGNYAPYPDGNVPRQGLYFSYRRVCEQYGIPHINTATLGKAIRHCFPTIKTRRLGVRGNSKYHYCGIRPATSAEAEWLQDYIRKSNNTAAQQSVNAARLASEQAESQRGGEDRSDDEDEDDSEGASSGRASKRNSFALGNGLKSPVLYHEELLDKTPTAATLLADAQVGPRSRPFPAQAPIRRHPSDALSIQPGLPGAAPFSSPSQPATSVRQLPHFPSIEDALGSSPSNSSHAVAAREVWGWFLDHLDSLLESVRFFRFDQFEMQIRAFWSNLQGAHREVVHAPAIAGLMAKGDAIVYDEILETLRAQLLSTIPPPALANLRGLADKMEKILLFSLEGYGNTFVEPKVELGARFGHLVLRFLDIYQVTQALTTVLTNQKQLSDMRRSWDKIDFESVRNQSALVCNCRHEDLVQLLEVEFRTLMDSMIKSGEPARDVMAWADKCCERLMGGHSTGSEERGTMSSRSVLIRWGYVTSQIMRDLTIRSDPTFGAFQILKLFLDDWIALNVLRNVALSTSSVAASVEPVMQQHFMGLDSMMASDSSFGASGSQPLLGQTPTTSSMLAALHQDPFPSGPLDGASSFNPENYGLSYLDAGAAHDDPLAVHPGGLGFSEYGSGSSFDVGGFMPQDLGLGSSAGEHERDAEVKAESA